MPDDLLVGNVIVASRPARLAIHQAVSAEPHIDLRLAQDTKLFTRAIRFALLALRAHNSGSRLGGHSPSVVRKLRRANMTEVIMRSEVKGQRAEVRIPSCRLHACTLSLSPLRSDL